MASADMELSAARMIARGNVLAQAIHDERPWFTMVYGCCEHTVPARRHILPGRIVFSSYLRDACSGIRTVDLYCGDQMVMTRDVPGSPSAPCRITLSLGVRTAELAG